MLDNPTDILTMEVLFVFVTVAVVLTFIILYLFQKYVDTKRKLREASSQLKNPVKIIRDYLEAQYSNTRQYHQLYQDLNTEFKPDVKSLRLAYLKIERSALNSDPKTAKYWSHLNENLTKLLKILAPSKFGKNNAEDNPLSQKISSLKDRIDRLPADESNLSPAQKKRLQHTLDGVKKRASEKSTNDQRIQNNLKKVAFIVDVFEDPKKRQRFFELKHKRNYATRSSEIIDNLDKSQEKSGSNIDEWKDNIDPKVQAGLQEKLDQFESENKGLNSHVEALKSQILDLKLRLKEQETHPPDQIDTPASDKANTLDLTDEILEANEKEIGRLRDVISDQRQSLADMECALKELESSSSSSGDQDHIEKLKRCIQESETCIVMLEEELSVLKNELNAIRTQAPDAPATDSQKSQLEDEILVIKNELDSSIEENTRNRDILDFGREAMGATSLEELSLLVYDKLTNMGFQANLIFKSSDRPIELSPHGSIIVRDKVSINNLAINEVGQTKSGTITFRFNYISGVLKKETTDSHSDSYRKMVVDLIRFSDQIWGHLWSAQKGKKLNSILANCSNSLKKVSYDMDKMIEQQNSKTKSMVDSSLTQVKNVARAKGLSATDISTISNIQQEAINQIEADDVIRLKLRKKFLELVNSLEQNK